MNCLGPAIAATALVPAIAATATTPAVPAVPAVPFSATSVGSPDGTVCTNMKPFKIGVHTDGVEYAHPTATAEHLHPNNAGFNLNYFMKTSCIWYKITKG